MELETKLEQETEQILFRFREYVEGRETLKQLANWIMLEMELPHLENKAWEPVRYEQWQKNVFTAIGNPIPAWLTYSFLLMFWEYQDGHRSEESIREWCEEQLMSRDARNLEQQRVFNCIQQWIATWSNEEDKKKNHERAQVIRQFGADLWHSALLQRLLAGKQPLPEAPPLSFSYPWYNLIEDGYADRCMVHELAEEKLWDKDTIAINQEIWHIDSRNEDGTSFVVHHKSNPEIHYRASKQDEESSPFNWRIERIEQ